MFKRIELPKYVTVYELHVDIPDNKLDTYGVSILFSSMEQAENALKFIAKELIDSGMELWEDCIYVEERVMFLTDGVIQKDCAGKTKPDSDEFYHFLFKYIREKENY